MSNPRGWNTETYNKTAYNAGVHDFVAGHSIRDNLYNNKSLREMWEKGWWFAFDQKFGRNDRSTEPMNDKGDMWK